jgi:hypothetical protein
MIRYSRVIGGQNADGSFDDDFTPKDYSASESGYGSHKYVAHNKEGKAIALAQVDYSPTHDVTYMDYKDRNTGNVDLIANGQKTHGGPHGSSRDAKPGEQLVMFDHLHSPAKAEVSDLYARDNPAAKVAAMTLLGMADMASTVVTGHHLKPSNNLSNYSGALVNRLLDSGAISKEDTEYFDPYDSNHTTFLGAETTLNYHPFNRTGSYQNLNSRIPHARARIREALGKPKRELGPQFTQMQFEGFE